MVVQMGVMKVATSVLLLASSSVDKKEERMVGKLAS